MGGRAVFFSLLALSVAAGFACGQAPPPREAASAPPSRIAAVPVADRSAASAPIPDDLSPEEKRDIEIFRRASASVVFITSIALQQDIFSMNIYKIPQGSGSGFVWDKKGHVVTNFHVIESGDRFKVTLADGSDWDAEVVGTAQDKDLAVLKIPAPAERLQPLPVGSSHDLLVGQRVLAVGNPFGLDHTLTVGVVSALGRELDAPNGRTIHDVIQTDAAINPGNSGGPLLDSRGRLIGVNSQIVSPSGASAGIGFAIPVDTVAHLVPQLIERGYAVQPGIGASFVSDAAARNFEIQGAAIYQVADGSPADRAGLVGPTITRFRRVRFGDIIVAVDGKAVRGADDVQYAFEKAGVDATVTLTVERDGKRRDVRVRLVPQR